MSRYIMGDVQIANEHSERMLEILFLRIYFERGLIRNLHLSGKKIAEIVVSCYARHHKYLHVEKSYYSMPPVIFNIFWIQNEMTHICPTKFLPRIATKKEKYTAVSRKVVG